MAFPTIADVTSAPETGTSMNVDMPNTVNDGDLLILIIAADSAPTFSTVASGWTEKKDNASGTNHAGAIFQKKADGSEGGTTVLITCSENQGGASMIIRVNSGTWSGTETDVEYSTWATSGGTEDSSPDPDNVTASWGSDDNLFIAVATWGDDDESVSSYPTSYASNNNHSEGGHGAGESASIGCATPTTPSASASANPGAFTLGSNANWTAGTIVVRPAGDPAYDQEKFRFRNDDGAVTEPA